MVVIRMARIRKQMSIDKETEEYILEYQRLKGYSHPGEAVEMIVKKHKEENIGSQVAEGIALITANAVLKELKPLFDVLRIRTGYADKQTKVMLEVLNSMIIAMRLNDSPAVTTDILESGILNGSTKHVTDQIEHFKQVKDAKKPKAKKPSKAGDD